MGGQSSKIDTSAVRIQEIKATSPVEQGRFCPPFRKFRNQKINIDNRRMMATVEVEQPTHESISINQQIFQDLEEAFDSKTKQIQLQSVLRDDLYIDLRTYLGRQRDKDLTIQLKPFSNLNSYTFNNILYEIYMNEQIAKLNCPNLNTIQDKYIVQTGLQLEGEENPNTQVFVLGPIATNLSQMIKYRRDNNWPWTTNEFNALASDLTNALNVLHSSKISHNDIRPCNVYYSLDKNCYQLGSFGNAVKTQSGNSTLAVSQLRTSTFFGAPELSTAKQANFQQADIYSLGMTLLCAFYLCQPVDRKAVNEYNRKFEGSYSVMSAIREMIMPIDKRSNISIISKRIPKGSNSTNMRNLISSLRYKNNPKDKQLVYSKKLLSDGYQRLGLWGQWKNQHHQAYELEQGILDDYKKANSLYELAKIQSCRGQEASATQYAKSASKIYRGLGYSAYDQGNVNESLNLFTRAIECSKYFQNKYDMDTAKNLQGLALAHSDKGDYELSKPLINQSTSIVVRNAGKDSIDFCKVKMSEAKIQTQYGEFQAANKILQECLALADGKARLNQELGLKLKAQILHELGRNAMLNSTYESNRQAELLTKAERCLADSIAINEQFPNNHVAISNNIDTFGQIQLRRQNFLVAKNNFLKAEQIRNQFAQHNQGVINIQKQHAQTLCNLGACQNGMGNQSQALQHYNQALQIYRRLYGSDHNKQSAMAIGNMSKVYYKLNDKNKARDCLKVATQILQEVVGDDDPDYEHFKHLESTL